MKYKPTVLAGLFLLSTLSGANEPPGSEKERQAIIVACQKEIRFKGAVEVEAIEGNFSRARMTNQFPSGETEDALVYLKKEKGKWTVLDYGTSFSKEGLSKHGVPATLWFWTGE